MRIEQLEYLAAVTRHGSLRRASESLHLSQPALSEALGKLERELGVPLLDRRRSGARISRQGQDLLPYMTQVLEAVDRLRQAAGDQPLVPRNLRVGTVNAASSALLVPAVQEVRRSSGGIGVDVLSSQARRDLPRRRRELARPRPGQPAARRRRAAAPGRARAAAGPAGGVPARRPPAGRRSRPSPSTSCARSPFITMRPGYLMHRFVHRLLRRRGCPRRRSPPTAPRWAS